MHTCIKRINPEAVAGARQEVLLPCTAQALREGFGRVRSVAPLRKGGPPI
jgi:hypothetical protein